MKYIINKVAVLTGSTEKCKSVIEFTIQIGTRHQDAKYDISAEAIDLDSGCHCNKEYYLKNGFTLISFKDFEKYHLHKKINYEIYY